MIGLAAFLAWIGGATLLMLVIYGMAGDDWSEWLTDWPSGMPVSIAGILACMISGPMIVLAMVMPAWGQVWIVAGAWWLAMAVAVAARFYHLFVELRHMRQIKHGKARKKKGPAV